MPVRGVLCVAAMTSCGHGAYGFASDEFWSWWSVKRADDRHCVGPADVAAHATLVHILRAHRCRTSQSTGQPQKAALCVKSRHAVDARCRSAAKAKGRRPRAARAPGHRPRAARTAARTRPRKQHWITTPRCRRTTRPHHHKPDSAAPRSSSPVWTERPPTPVWRRTPNLDLQ